MTKLKIAIAALAAICSFSSPAKAADFKVHADKDFVYLDITGKIDLMDGLVVKAAAAKLNSVGKPIVVNLDSPGGNVIGGLGIANTIAINGWSTIVDADTMCASICADIWLAGKTRYAHSTAKIGMHSAGLTVKGKTLRADDGNLPRIKLFVALGISKDAIVGMLSPDPDSMMWMTPAWAKNVGIKYTVSG